MTLTVSKPKHRRKQFGITPRAYTVTRTGHESVGISGDGDFVGADGAGETRLRMAEEGEEEGEGGAALDVVKGFEVGG